MTREDLVRYWRESSDEDAGTMHHLLDHGDFTWALFIGHICLEKALKSKIVEQENSDPPRTHDLVRLAESAGLALEDDVLDFLDTATTFNIRARYDDYKREFASRCTREYTEAMVARIEEVRGWILRRR